LLLSFVHIHISTTVVYVEAIASDSDSDSASKSDYHSKSNSASADDDCFMCGYANLLLAVLSNLALMHEASLWYAALLYTPQFPKNIRLARGHGG